jgi:hypothetical protein
MHVIRLYILFLTIFTWLLLLMFVRLSYNDFWQVYIICIYNAHITLKSESKTWIFQIKYVIHSNVVSPKVSKIHTVMGFICVKEFDRLKLLNKCMTYFIILKQSKNLTRKNAMTLFFYFTDLRGKKSVFTFNTWIRRILRININRPSIKSNHKILIKRYNGCSMVFRV